MTISERIEALGYPVDYPWLATHSDSNDLCLVGRLQGKDVQAARGALERLLLDCEQYDAQVDGEPSVLAMDGGVRARLVRASDGDEVELYSSGEDAADSIAEFSDLVAQAIRSVPGRGCLVWEALPADRPDHHFSF